MDLPPQPLIPYPTGKFSDSASLNAAAIGYTRRQSGISGGRQFARKSLVNNQQMAMVAAVVLVFVFIFCTVCCSIWSSRIAITRLRNWKAFSLCPRTLIFCHFERRYSRSEAILASIKPAGVVSRADVVLPTSSRRCVKVLFQSVRCR